MTGGTGHCLQGHWVLENRSYNVGRILLSTHHPHADNAFVLNLEELATLWHLPGAAATTPGIRRVDSVKVTHQITYQFNEKKY